MRGTTRLVVAVTAAAVASPIGGSPTQATAPESRAVVATRPHASRPAPWVKGNPTFTPPTRKPANIGVNYHAMWSDLSDAGRATMLDRYANAGVEWVRIDVSWDSIQPVGPTSYDMTGGVAKLAKRLDEVKARGMKAMVMFYWAPKWSSGTTAKNGVPRSAREYATAVAWLAKRFAGRLHAIEIWNEPDLDAFLANRSVVTYTNLLKAAYPKIKAANPDMFVVAGAPTGINTNWYTQMYANGGAHMFDALGIHPYMGNTDEHPTKCDTKYIQYYPCNITNLVNLMKANGDGNRQIWATEYGWSTHDNSTYGAPIPSWKRGVSYATQARHVIAMQEVLARWPQVTNSFWYTDRNTANSDAQEANLGLLYRDFSPKPAYYAMKCVASKICGPRTNARPTSRPRPHSRTARATVTRQAQASFRARIWSRRLHQHVRARARAYRSASATATAHAATTAAAVRIARARATRRALHRAAAEARRAVQHKARSKAHRKAALKLRRRI